MKQMNHKTRINSVFCVAQPHNAGRKQQKIFRLFFMTLNHHSKVVPLPTAHILLVKSSQV